MLEGRSIDFEKSFRYEKISSRFPEARLSYEYCTQFIIHRHIEVSLPIAFIIVGDTMPLLRKWSDGLGEEGELLHEEGEFSLMRIKKFSSYSDEISEVYEFFSEFVGG